MLASRRGVRAQRDTISLHQLGQTTKPTTAERLGQRVEKEVLRGHFWAPAYATRCITNTLKRSFGGDQHLLAGTMVHDQACKQMLG